ncbi:MAG: SIMPL domain-containing protein [Phycisphaerales bacterium]
MHHTVRVNWIGAVAVLVAGVGMSVIASTTLAARAFRARIAQIERADQQVTVKGYARAPVRSDTATWTMSVTGRGATLSEAFGDIRSASGRLEAYLVDQGFEPGAVASSAISTTEIRKRDDKGRETLGVLGYVLSRTYTVATGDVERVARAAAGVTELLADDVPVVSGTPEYTVSGLPDVKIDIVGRASADARARAEEIASRAGARLAEVRTAYQGVMQVTAPNSTQVSGYGIYDTATIDKEASIVMTVTFGLE